MPRYRWNPESGSVEEVIDSGGQRATQTFQIMRDLPGYKSPLGTGWIEGRAARREDMKRGNCREVDPSEWKGGYTNPSFASKRGLPMGKD